MASPTLESTSMLLWQKTLAALGRRFEHAGRSRQISTFIIHTTDTDSGRRRLRGPGSRHWMNVNSSAMAAADFRVHDETSFPCRAVYFGGLKDGAAELQALAREAGALLYDMPVDRKLLATCSSRIDWMPRSATYPLNFIDWLCTVEQCGLQQDSASGFEIEPQRWKQDTWMPFPKWPPSRAPHYFATYIHNIFVASAAACRMLGASRPIDTWVTAAEAASAIGINRANITRQADELKLTIVKDGRGCRVDPKGVVLAIVRRNKHVPRERKEQLEKIDTHREWLRRWASAAMVSPSAKVELDQRLRALAHAIKHVLKTS